MKKVLVWMMALLMVIGVMALPQNVAVADGERVAYVTFEPIVQSGGMITSQGMHFYYDDQKEARSEVLDFVYDLDYDENGMPLWYNDHGLVDLDGNPISKVHIKITRAAFDTSFADYAPTSMRYWFYGLSDLSFIDFTNLNSSKITDLRGTFAYTALKSNTDFTVLDTSMVTDWNGTFMGMTKLDEIDFSGMDFSATLYMNHMFDDCTSLKTIFVDENTKLPNIDLHETFAGIETVFTNCVNLVGGNGTTYDETRVNRTFFRLDGGPDSENPGYLTAIDEAEEPTPETYDIYVDKLQGIFGNSYTLIYTMQASEEVEGPITFTLTINGSERTQMATEAEMLASEYACYMVKDLGNGAYQIKVKLYAKMLHLPALISATDATGKELNIRTYEKYGINGEIGKQVGHSLVDYVEIVSAMYSTQGDTENAARWSDLAEKMDAYGIAVHDIER